MNMTTYPPFFDFTLRVAPESRIFTDIDDNLFIEYIINRYFHDVVVGQWAYQFTHYSYFYCSFITGCGGTYRTRQELENDIPRYKELLNDHGFMIKIRDTPDKVVIEGRPTIDRFNACIGIYMMYIDNLPQPPSFIYKCFKKLNTVLSKLKNIYPWRSFIIYHNNNNDVCSICFTGEDDFVQLSCRHIFHRKCIETWINIQRTCPLCRHVI